jgi:hypothetical protein
MNLVLHSVDYLMNNSYKRISSGKDFDENFKPYTQDFIKDMVAYFESNEDYEKCQLLVKYTENRFDHEKNYLYK